MPKTVQHVVLTLKIFLEVCEIEGAEGHRTLILFRFGRT